MSKGGKGERDRQEGWEGKSVKPRELSQNIAERRTERKRQRQEETEGQ